VTPGEGEGSGPNKRLLFEVSPSDDIGAFIKMAAAKFGPGAQPAGFQVQTPTGFWFASSEQVAHSSKGEGSAARDGLWHCPPAQPFGANKNFVWWFRTHAAAPLTVSLYFTRTPLPLRK
jgi:hypothetical protein